MSRNKQIIEQPYNGYVRHEDEGGDPLAYYDGDDQRDGDITDRDIAHRHLRISAEILLHLRAMTGERFNEKDITEVIP